MKLTKSVIRQFEQDQKANGTECALTNFVFCQASDLLHGVGVKNIKVTYFPSKQKQRITGRSV